MVTSFPAEQVTNLVRAKTGEVFLATSNPGRVHVLEAGGRDARDVHLQGQGHRHRLELGPRALGGASCPRAREIQVQTRSGNTGTPDSTWSAWSAPYTGPTGAPIASEPARFLQMRVVLVGQRGPDRRCSTPLAAAYLQRNLRPQIQSITVHPPGEVFQKPISLSGDVEILGLDEPRSPRGPARPDGPPRRTCRRPPPTAASSTRRACRRSRGGRTIPTATRSCYDVSYRPLGGHAVPSAQEGRHRRRPGLGHHHRPQRPLRHQGDGQRRAQQPVGGLRSPATRRARPSTWTTRRRR